jgi:hypothetical protein
MAARVQEHVSERVPNFLRRFQHVDVVPIGKHPARPVRHPIHRARQAGSDRHHATAERFTVLRLDDEVRVIPLE